MNLGAISTLVFDLDGVVWRGDAPIESAIVAINRLRDAGKRCLFCTNMSAMTQAEFVEKLASMGLKNVAEEEVITSSVATATYLSAQFTGPFLTYVVGTDGIRLALQKIGARIVPDSDITDDTNVDCVVVGIDREFTYAKLDIAQRLIRRGALFVATNRDATYPIEDGVIPGAGAIVASVETAAGSTPVTIGKPRPVMLQLIMQQYNLQPEEVAFIGDRLDTDIVCARRAGVPALLVTTGVTTLADARRAKGEMRPDAVFPELESLAGVLLNELHENGETTDAELPTMTGGAAEEISELQTETAIAAEGTEGIEAVAESTPSAESEEAAPVREAQTESSESAEIPSIGISETVETTQVAETPEAQTAVPSAAVDETWFSEGDAASGEAKADEDFDFDEAFQEVAAGEETAPNTDAEPEPEKADDAAAGSPPAADDDGFNWKLD